MIRVRPYLPLLGFVVPTVVVAYGFVIPRSCIAGINELSVGFGTTILGAVLTYIAGQRAVLPKATCSRAPLLVRLARALNRQAAHPRGFIGRMLGSIWVREHARLNLEVLDRLDIEAGHRVLEIGSGPGDALMKAARRARGGKAVGVDVSEVMVKLARARVQAARDVCSVEVRLRSGSALGIDGERYDRIFAVHSIYFWGDVDATFVQLATALAPGGKLVLAFRPDGDDVPARFRDPIYRFPTVDAVMKSLKRAGFSEVRAERSTVAPTVAYVLASSAASSASPD